MIRMILKRIWKQRKNNTWLFIQCLVVSLILVIIISYVNIFVQLSKFPRGFSAEDVYVVMLGEDLSYREKLTEEEIVSLKMNALNNIQDMLSDNNNIKDFCLYATNGIIHPLFSLDYNLRTNFFGVDTNFFKIFDIEILSSNGVEIGSKKFNQYWNTNSNILPSIVSEDAIWQIFASDSLKASSYDAYISRVFNIDKDLRITAISPPIINRPISKTSAIFYPMDIQDIASLPLSTPKIALKTHSGEDPEIEMFEIAPYYLEKVLPYKESKDSSGKNNMYSASIYAIIFLLINIFIGTLGLFSFKIKDRYSEIGLRLATGATKSNILKEYITEGIVLLSLAFIPVIIITANIFYISAPTLNIGIKTYSLSSFFIDTTISYLIMCTIISLAIILPASKAMKIQPAEALKDE